MFWAEDIRSGAGRALLVSGCLCDLALHRGMLLGAKDVSNIVWSPSGAAGSIGRSHMAAMVVWRASRVH